MIKIIATITSVVLLTGCATSNDLTYSVISEPSGAQIDVNGVGIGATPTEISLGCSKRWVGLMNSPGGLANTSGKYEVTAYPPKNFTGQSQTKSVDPCQWAGSEKPVLKFDLGLENVSPTQKIEIITDSSSDKYGKAIQSLRTLRDQGVITEDEYRRKILKLTE